MPTHKKKQLLLALLVLGGAFLIRGGKAQAATILSQPDYTSTQVFIPTNGAAAPQYYLGTALVSGTPAGLTYYVNSVSGSPTYSLAGMNDVTNGHYFAASQAQFQTFHGQGFYTVFFDAHTDTVAAGDTLEYFFAFADNTAGFTFTRSAYVPADYYGNPFVYVFETGDSPYGTPGVTSFVQPYTPANGALADLGTTTFSFQYNNPCASFGQFDSAGIELRDTESPGTEPPVNFSTIACGTGTYTAGVALTPSDTYLWRPVLSSSDGKTPSIYGTWYNIGATTAAPGGAVQYLVSSSSILLATSSNPLPTQPCSITDISGCFENALSYLFYPTVNFATAFVSIPIQQKIPFVYAYQINLMRQDLLSASSTAPASLTVSLWRLPGSSATTTLTLISEPMLAAVPFSSTIYAIITFLIWLGMAEYVYYRVIRMHDTHTPS